MENLTEILTGLVGVAIVILIAPRILAANRGKILQNIAIWVGIFLVLALIYKTYGPGKLEAPQGATDAPAYVPKMAEPSDKDAQAPSQEPINEDQGFIPPKEE